MAKKAHQTAVAQLSPTADVEYSIDDAPPQSKTGSPYRTVGPWSDDTRRAVKRNNPGFIERMTPAERARMDFGAIDRDIELPDDHANDRAVTRQFNTGRAAMGTRKPTSRAMKGRR